MLDAVLIATDNLISLNSLFFLTLGTCIGLVFGAIPGLGGTTAIALLIPLTFGMENFEAIVLMGGVMASTSTGGSVSAILLNTPGIAPNAATTFDGYPLAQQGKAGLALGAGATASALGGLIGVVTLVAFIPIAKEVVLLFAPAEFFLLALFGLCAIAASTGGRLLQGLITAGVGLIVGFVGFDGVSGEVRYTFGITFLWDGVKLVPALIGLFALAEMINLSVKGGTVAENPEIVKIQKMFDGVKAVFRNYPTMLRGSAIGTLIGAVPGVGGTVAAFLSYSTQVQVAKDPETYGKGNILGVIAPESANNAKDGGSLIPTLAFGIPGSAETAVFLGVLILHGLDPGPTILFEHEDVIFTLILTLTVACVLATLIVLSLARAMALLTLIDVHILVPAVSVVALVGAYALQTEIGDVFVALVFAVVGYFMIRFDYPRVTFTIALVLGEITERSFHQTMMISDGDWSIFVTRGVSIMLLLLILTSLCVPSLRLWSKKRKQRREPAA